MKQFELFTKGNETFVREKNPHEQYGYSRDKHGKIDGGYIDPDWAEFEQSALAVGKPLTNPEKLGDKTVVGEDELKEVWQEYDVNNGKWYNNITVDVIDGGFSLYSQSSQVQGVKTRLALEYIQPAEEKETQAAREGRCLAECEHYYLHLLPKEHIEWFRKGVEIGAKWVDSGDKIIV